LNASSGVQISSTGIVVSSAGMVITSTTNGAACCCGTTGVSCCPACGINVLWNTMRVTFDSLTLCDCIFDDVPFSHSGKRILDPNITIDLTQTCGDNTGPSGAYNVLDPSCCTPCVFSAEQEVGTYQSFSGSSCSGAASGPTFPVWAKVVVAFGGCGFNSSLYMWLRDIASPPYALAFNANLTTSEICNGATVDNLITSADFNCWHVVDNPAVCGGTPLPTRAVCQNGSATLTINV
jgi:hypothetical protein